MSFTKIRLLTAGESHGPNLTAILEGMPAGLTLSRERLQHQMKRRQLGYGRGGRMKIESDEVDVTAGVRMGQTLGSPIAILIRNKDFSNWQDVMSVWKQENGVAKKAVHRPRPGHADLAGGLKYSEKDLRNILERASARESAARTACGAICRQLCEELGIEIASHVIAVGPVAIRDRNIPWSRIAEVQDSERLRCVEADTEQEMIRNIDQARANKETLGGIFELVARNVPPGLGSHVHWDRKLDGRLAQAVLSIPAVKGVAIGDAFEQAKSFGSQAHDEIFFDDKALFHRKTNRAGGLEGGITNGEELRITAAMKPLSTLMRPLQSVDIVTKQAEEAVVERSDVCAVPAAAVVGEAMLALVLADALLEKFSSDSMVELTAAVSHYKQSLKNY